MLHVLFVLLKILGIFLLVLLGVFLVLLCTVLVVPVRYRLEGAYQKTLTARAAASWLLGLVSVRAAYDGVLTIRARLLWFVLFEDRFFGAEQADKEELQPGNAQETEEIRPVDSHAGGSPAGGGESLSGQGHTGAGGEEAKAANPSGPEAMPEPAEAAELVGALELSDGPKGPEDDFGADSKTEGEHIDQEEDGIGPRGFFGRLYERLLSFLKRLLGLFSQTRAKLEQGQKTLEKAKAFWDDAENKRMIALLVSQTKKLILHVLPRRLRGRLRFGFEDPYRTGQVLTAVSPFYVLYAKSFTLEPVFDEKVLDGEVHVKGHIRAGTLLWIGIRILMNKNFRRLLRKWK